MVPHCLGGGGREKCSSRVLHDSDEAEREQILCPVSLQYSLLHQGTGYGVPHANILFVRWFAKDQCRLNYIQQVPMLKRSKKSHTVLLIVIIHGATFYTPCSLQSVLCYCTSLASHAV